MINIKKKFKNFGPLEALVLTAVFYARGACKDSFSSKSLFWSTSCAPE